MVGQDPRTLADKVEEDILRLLKRIDKEYVPPRDWVYHPESHQYEIHELHRIIRVIHDYIENEGGFGFMRKVRKDLQKSQQLLHKRKKSEAIAFIKRAIKRIDAQKEVIGHLRHEYT